MLTILLPLLVAVVGLVLYAISANPKVSELGRIAYFCGLLVVTFALSRVVLKIP